jgi:hypothetical protein
MERFLISRPPAGGGPEDGAEDEDIVGGLPKRLYVNEVGADGLAGKKRPSSGVWVSVQRLTDDGVEHFMKLDLANKKFTHVCLALLAAVNSEGFCERVFSEVNNTMTSGNTLLADEELQMLALLRMNREFIGYMRSKYPGTAVPIPLPRTTETDAADADRPVDTLPVVESELADSDDEAV